LPVSGKLAIARVPVTIRVLWRPLEGFAVSAALVAAALALRLAMGDLLLNVPYITFYSVVAIGAFVGGWRAGLFAAVLSVLAAVYFLLPPTFSFNFAPE
jgi:K+-sensing histidine kinase KdpD